MRSPLTKAFLAGAVVCVVGALGLASCATPPRGTASGAPAPAAPASAPTPVPEPAPAPKVAKERVVVVKVPVLVKESSFYSDGLLDEYVTYQYDESRTRLLEKVTYDASKPRPVERVVSEWRDGRVAVDTSFDADGKAKLRREYRYDESGRLVEERAIDAKGQPQSSSAYAYDGAGRKVEWRAFDGKGLLVAVTLYAYSPDSIDMRDPGGKTKGRIEVEAGTDGRPLQRTYLAADGKVQKREAYVYEAAAPAAPAALELRRADGSLASRTAYSCGPSGELVRSETRDSSGALRDFKTYEYLVREDSRIEIYYE